MNKYEAYVATVVLLGVAILGVLLYGVLIYNHTQDVNRDKYYADHCKNVGKNYDYAGSTHYQCGGSK